MDSRISHDSYVINFLDVNLHSSHLSQILKVDADRFLRQIEIEGLVGWEVEFRGAYGKGEQIRVYKQTRSNSTEKYKSIVIHIPIPTKKIVPWGVEEGQLTDLLIPPNSKRYFDYLPVNFSSFSNINDYLIDSFRRGIRYSFEGGFKANGHLVIYTSN